MLEKLGQVCGIVGKHLMIGIFFGGDFVNFGPKVGEILNFGIFNH
jgi:hypothetical protein